jgi:hypothetical protein
MATTAPPDRAPPRPTRARRPRRRSAPQGIPGGARSGLPVFAVAGRLPGLTNLVARPLVPSNRKAEPLDRNSALPFTSGFEPTVAILPPFHPS